MFVVNYVYCYVYLQYLSEDPFLFCITYQKGGKKQVGRQIAKYHAQDWFFSYTTITEIFKKSLETDP